MSAPDLTSLKLGAVDDPEAPTHTALLRETPVGEPVQTDGDTSKSAWESCTPLFCLPCEQCMVASESRIGSAGVRGGTNDSSQFEEFCSAIQGCGCCEECCE